MASTMEIARGAVELDGRRVSYLTAGDAAAGPTLLLIHGSGVSARYWVNQLRGLGGALPVIAVDLPGHGESDPMEHTTVEAYGEVVADFLDALDRGPVIAAGHSLGGAIALTLAVRRPDAVRGLVLLSSCVKLPWVGGPGERLLASLPWTCPSRRRGSMLPPWSCAGAGTGSLPPRRPSASGT